MFTLYQFKQCWREQKPATAESGAARSHNILREKQESATGTARQEVTEKTTPHFEGMSVWLSVCQSVRLLREKNTNQQLGQLVKGYRENYYWSPRYICLIVYQSVRPPEEQETSSWDSLCRVTEKTTTDLQGISVWLSTSLSVHQKNKNQQLGQLVQGYRENYYWSPRYICLIVYQSVRPPTEKKQEPAAGTACAGLQRKLLLISKVCLSAVCCLSVCPSVSLPVCLSASLSVHGEKQEPAAGTACAGLQRKQLLISKVYLCDCLSLEKNKNQQLVQLVNRLKIFNVGMSVCLPLKKKHLRQLMERLY